VLSVIVDDTRDPARNLALDEALARAREPTPLLRVWQNDPSVVIGRFQRPAEAVDLAACARDGIPVLRRATGGGAVFTDPGSLNVTLVCSSPGIGLTADAASALDELMATAVAGLGLQAGVRGGVLRSASLRTGSRLLVHAALHITTVSAYGRAYLASAETMADLGLPVNLDAVRAAVFAAVVDRYGTACTRRPSPAEMKWRDHLLATRYADISWHLLGGRRSPRVAAGRFGMDNQMLDCESG
jgi:lipoate-protein ligase A